MMQPTIAPLFKTRAWEESLMKWSGSNISHYDFVKNYWTTKLGGTAAFDKAIQSGVIEPETMLMSGAAFTGNAADAQAKVAAVKASAEGQVDLVIYEKVGIGRGGAWSNNPWLQEMPDPVSKCTWDNYILISPNRAKKMGAEHTDLNEVDRDKKVFKIKANNTTVDLPVLVLPGMHDDVIAVAVGYGRDKGAGIAAGGNGKSPATGKNVYP